MAARDRPRYYFLVSDFLGSDHLVCRAAGGRRQGGGKLLASVSTATLVTTRLAIAIGPKNGAVACCGRHRAHLPTPGVQSNQSVARIIGTTTSDWSVGPRITHREIARAALGKSCATIAKSQGGGIVALGLVWGWGLAWGLAWAINGTRITGRRRQCAAPCWNNLLLLCASTCHEGQSDNQGACQNDFGLRAAYSGHGNFRSLQLGRERCHFLSRRFNIEKDTYPVTRTYRLDITAKMLVILDRRRCIMLPAHSVCA